MGRKSLVKTRKIDVQKKNEWAKSLFLFFQRYGIKGNTMDDMAQWLGKSKSTLYEYFKSKNEILELAIFSKIEEVKGYREILENENETFRQRYIDFLRLVTTQNAAVTSLFLADLQAYFPDQWRIIELFLQDLIQSLSEYYKKGIQAGAFKNIHVALLVAEDRHFIFDLMTNARFLEENQLKMHELVEQYLSLKLDGLEAN